MARDETGQFGRAAVWAGIGAVAAFFGFIHLTEPHAPYDRGSVKSGPQLERYVSEVAETDRYLGKIITTLSSYPLAGRSILVVTSDHGEAFGEHGTVQHTKTDDRLRVHLHEVLHDSSHDLGVDPGLVKDGVEAHLQELLAEHVDTLGEGYTLVRREYPTAIGPVDLLVRDATGGAVAVGVKRRGEIDGVEQLTRYLDLLNRDPLLAPVSGVFAAQEIKPQARVLATDRGIRCLVLDYDSLRGHDNSEHRLF